MLKNKFNILKLMVLVLLFVGVGKVNAQSTLDFRINEILVYNDSNYVDDFGQHSAWIEIFNTAFNTVDIGGLYLTDDLNNPTKYLIPKGQPTTLIPPEGYIVFWADNEPTRGITHLNFKLEENKTLYLFQSDGKTLVDSVTIVANQKPDVTFGRLEDGESEWDFLAKSTPNANNNTEPKISEADKFVIVDPTGIGMAVIAMSVVFSALAVLYLFFRLLGHYMTRETRVNNKAKAENDPGKVTTEVISGEVNAAIAMALYLYGNQMHDKEDPVITIAKVSKTYSPWSSKIYGLRKLPR